MPTTPGSRRARERWWIRQAIDRGLAMQSRTIRIPTHAVGELSRFSRVERKLALRLGRAPTIAELAAETGTAADRIEELRLAARDAVSLDTPVVGTTMGELIEDADGPTAADIVEQHVLTDELQALLATLPAREATIVAMRFGPHDGHQRTLKEVAEHVGLTRERVRQAEKQAIAQLRDPARHRSLIDWAAA